MEQQHAVQSKYVRHRRGVTRKLDDILAEVSDLRAAVLAVLVERERAAERGERQEEHRK